MLGRSVGGLAVLAAAVMLLFSAPARATVGRLNVEVVQTDASLSQRLTRLPDLQMSSFPPAPCPRQRLRVRLGSTERLGSRWMQVVVLSVTAGSQCSLRGYPALTLLGRRRRMLRVPERHGGSGLFEDPGPHPTILAPGEPASFALGGGVTGGRRRSCRRAAVVQLTLPGVQGVLALAAGLAACPSGLTLSAIGPGADSAAFGASSPVIGVDAALRYQRIVGVGAAMTDSSAWLIYDELDPARRAALIAHLFGPRGIRLPFTLVPMGASDFTAGGVPYTYDDMPPGQSDPGLADFSIAHDQPYVLPALRQVLAVDPSEEIFAVPWTAPAWMKANDAFDDLRYQGTILPADYGPWAEYFVKFLQAYAAAGVTVGAIAPENEPEAPSAFPAMNFPQPAESQWIADYLQPALQRAGLRPQIFGYDGSWRSPAYPEALLRSAAASALAGIAWHCYSGAPAVMDAVHELAARIRQIVTECSPGISPYNASELMIGAFRHWATTAALWNLALDPAGGPVQPPNSGCRGCTGVVTITPGSDSFTYNAAYYQLGQFSRFVAPGARRIASPSFASYGQIPGQGRISPRISPGLADVAFRNPDGSIVLLAYNNSARAIEFTVRWAGRAFIYTLTPWATVTFAWRKA